MSQILIAAEMAFRRRDGCMPQKESNLLQLTTARVAELRIAQVSLQVMRRNMLQARSLAAGLDYVHQSTRETWQAKRIT